MRRMHSVSALPLLSSKDIVTGEENEMGDAYKHIIPLAQVEVNKCILSLEMVITVSFTYSFIVIWCSLERGII